MDEVIRDKYRGRGVGFVQTGAAVGPGLAALVYSVPAAAIVAATARTDAALRRAESPCPHRCFYIAPLCRECSGYNTSERLPRSTDTAVRSRRGNSRPF